MVVPHPWLTRPGGALWAFSAPVGPTLPHLGGRDASQYLVVAGGLGSGGLVRVIFRVGGAFKVTLKKKPKQQHTGSPPRARISHGIRFGKITTGQRSL